MSLADVRVLVEINKRQEIVFVEKGTLWFGDVGADKIKASDTYIKVPGKGAALLYDEAMKFSCIVDIV